MNPETPKQNPEQTNEAHESVWSKITKKFGRKSVAVAAAATVIGIGGVNEVTKSTEPQPVETSTISTETQQATPNDVRDLGQITLGESAEGNQLENKAIDHADSFTLNGLTAEQTSDIKEEAVEAEKTAKEFNGGALQPNDTFAVKIEENSEGVKEYNVDFVPPKAEGGVNYNIPGTLDQGDTSLTNSNKDPETISPAPLETPESQNTPR